MPYVPLSLRKTDRAAPRRDSDHDIRDIILYWNDGTAECGGHDPSGAHLVRCNVHVVQLIRYAAQCGIVFGQATGGDEYARDGH
jgi:hypothetical protein